MSGCTSADYPIIKLKTFVDSNITYTNLSCQTDVQYSTITKFDHKCSFDVIDNNPNPNDIITVKYSYCPYLGNCYSEGSLVLTNFKQGDSYHQEFTFSEFLINSIATAAPKFNFEGTRSVQV